MYDYIFISEYLDHKIVDKFFRERGNWNKISSNNINTKNINSVDFLYVDGGDKSQKYLWSMNKYIFNRVKIDRGENDIRDKNELYKSMKKKYPKIFNKYFPPQIELNIKTTNPNNYKKLFLNNKVWILKIVEGGGGKYVYVVPDYPTFVKRIKILQQINDTTLNKYPTFVLSEYITNPLTFKNKKFHLRLYYVYNPSNHRAYLHKYGSIFTAKKNYVSKNYQNKNIHDTHFGTTDDDYYFPHEFIKIYSKNTIFNIYKQLIELFHYVKLITKGECYPESEKCFQIFGADVMITENFEVRLLEINHRIGIKTYDNKLITEYLVNGMLETIVDPLLPPKYKQQKYNYFIEV